MEDIINPIPCRNKFPIMEVKKNKLKSGTVLNI